jgi:hypothetical protein
MLLMLCCYDVGAVALLHMWVITNQALTTTGTTPTEYIGGLTAANQSCLLFKRVTSDTIEGSTSPSPPAMLKLYLKCLAVARL